MSQELSSRLKTILEQEIGTVRMLGGKDKKAQRDTLRARLFSEASRAAQLFYVALFMVLVVFVVMLYLLVIYTGDTTRFVAISGASGLSISGLIWFALTISRDRTQLALMLIVLERLPSEDALAALQAILAGRIPDRSNLMAENLGENA